MLVVNISVLESSFRSTNLSFSISSVFSGQIVAYQELFSVVTLLASSAQPQRRVPKAGLGLQGSGLKNAGLQGCKTKISGL